MQFYQKKRADRHIEGLSQMCHLKPRREAADVGHTDLDD